MYAHLDKLNQVMYSLKFDKNAKSNITATPMTFTATPDTNAKHRSAHPNHETHMSVKVICAPNAIHFKYLANFLDVSSWWAAPQQHGELTAAPSYSALRRMLAAATTGLTTSRMAGVRGSASGVTRRRG